MALKTATPASRRALLTAGLGGLAALVAGALGRPAPTRAVNGDPLVAGSVGDASATTGVTTSAGHGLQGITSDANGAGVYGESAAGFGVIAKSPSGTGVYASSSSMAMYARGEGGWAAYADGYSGDKPAIFGQAKFDNTGVFGYSGLDFSSAPGSPGKTGIYGYANQDGTARGVSGESVGGTGVIGQSTDGPGMQGLSTSDFGVHGASGTSVGLHGVSNSNVGVHGSTQSTSLPAVRGAGNANGPGVQGYSGTGSVPAAPARTGVYGYAIQDATARGVHGRSTVGRGVDGQATTGVGLYGLATTGYALRTNGRVKLDKSAGSATITEGTMSKTVTPGVDLTASSVVLATLQGTAGGTTNVHRVAINATTNTFTIYLTANATASVKVGWILLS